MSYLDDEWAKLGTTTLINTGEGSVIYGEPDPEWVRPRLPDEREAFRSCVYSSGELVTVQGMCPDRFDDPLQDWSDSITVTDSYSPSWGAWLSVGVLLGAMTLVSRR